jgi:hypothetical protein
LRYPAQNRPLQVQTYGSSEGSQKMISVFSHYQTGFDISSRIPALQPLVR